MAKNKEELTKEEIKNQRLEKTKTFLDSIGVMMPILKDARPVEAIDIIKNKNLISLLDSFLLEHISETIDDKKISKMIQRKGTRKIILNKFVSERLSEIINELPHKVWDLLMTTIMVDTLEDSEEEWLDFEFPITKICDDYEKEIEWVHSDENMFASIQNEIAEYIDYVSMIVSMNVFRFSREIDELSRYQILGNIGSIEDVRSAVNLVFNNELFSDKINLEWITNIADKIK